MEIKAGEFKARCLELMDRVAENREEYVITKRGKPVAKLVPVEPESKRDLFGYMKGTGMIIGDIISPLDVEWEANA